MVSIGRKLDLLHEGHIINWLHVHDRYFKKISNLLASQNAFFLLNWDLLISTDYQQLLKLHLIFCVEMIIY